MIILDDDEIKSFVEEASKPFDIGIGGYKHGQLLIFMLWTFIRIGEGPPCTGHYRKLCPDLG